MNESSSRSHSIFSVVIEMSSVRPEDGKEKIIRGKLNLVDLAGSERASKTGATGARMKEGIKINLSLTALGNVISCLVENSGGGKQRHIPFRDSKLTWLLKDSLGGNTKTVMLAAIGPADYNYEETLSTLRYANRAKQIKNKPKVNEDPKDALLRQYKEEIDRLKTLLETHLKAAGMAPEAMAGILAAVGGGGAGGAPGKGPAPSKATQAASLAAMASQLGGEQGGAAKGPLKPPTSGRPRSESQGSDSGGGGDATPTSSSSSSGGGKLVSSGTSISGNSYAKSLVANMAPLTVRGAPGSARSASDPNPGALIENSTMEALKATQAALEEEKSKTEDMMRKMRALQDMVMGGGRKAGGGAGGGGGSTLSAYRSYGDLPPVAARPSSGSNPGAPSLGALEGEDAELLAARRREETRKARAAELQKSREEAMRAKLRERASMEMDGSGLEEEEEEGAAGAGAAAAAAAAAHSGSGGCKFCGRRGALSAAVGAQKEESESSPAAGADGPAAGGGGKTGDVPGTVRPSTPSTAHSKECESPLPFLSPAGPSEAAPAGSPEVEGPTSAAATSAPSGGERMFSKEEVLRIKAQLKRKYARHFGEQAAAVKNELSESKEEWGNERQRMADDLRDLNKHLSLLEAVVGLFLPDKEKDKAVDRASWDEDKQRWLLPRVKPRPGYKARSLVGAIAGVAGAGPTSTVRAPHGAPLVGGGGGKRQQRQEQRHGQSHCRWGEPQPGQRGLHGGRCSLWHLWGG